MDTKKQVDPLQSIGNLLWLRKLDLRHLRSPIFRLVCDFQLPFFSRLWWLDFVVVSMINHYCSEYPMRGSVFRYPLNPQPKTTTAEGSHWSIRESWLKTHASLVGGWTNPSQKLLVKIGSFPQIGMKIKKGLKPPPRSVTSFPSEFPNDATHPTEMSSFHPSTPIRAWMGQDVGIANQHLGGENQEPYRSRQLDKRPQLSHIYLHEW